MTAVSEQRESTNLVKMFEDTRKTSMDIVQTLEKDDFVVQTAFYTSPPKWHLGHVSWLFEIVLSKISKYEFFLKDHLDYLNSYYNQFGTPHDKGRRGVISRPTLEQIMEYYQVVTERVRDLLENRSLNEKESNLIKMACNHECQHQELLVYDLQHLLAEKYKPVKKTEKPKPSPVKKESRRISGGIYDLGYPGSDWCYDIELPEHKVYLEDFKIDIFPVTNAEFMEFIEDGGYSDFKYWLSDGWEAVKNNGWEAPMYWEKEDGVWYTRDFAGRRKINPNEPVVHVSFYEADAFCKWAGKRLPTEAEWEKAACWNEEKQVKTVFPWGNSIPTSQQANLLESHIWSCSEIGSYPEGVSHYGCHQMIGDVWEWTASEYVGYPRFKSGFSEYNDKWFTNQKVLRGGSFGTPKMSIRGSYRNFFRLDERWLFGGFRCVEDI